MQTPGPAAQLLVPRDAEAGSAVVVARARVRLPHLLARAPHPRVALSVHVAAHQEGHGLVRVCSALRNQ